MMSTIQTFEVIDCIELDVSATLKVIGNHTPSLKCIKYIFQDRKAPTTDDVLSLLVKNCMSELNTVILIKYIYIIE